MPLWPSGPPEPIPAPSGPPSPTSFDDTNPWPDPPGQLWPAYEQPARRRRTLPIVLGALAAVLLVAAGAVGALLLTNRPAPTANTAAPAPAATVSSAPATTPAATSSPAGSPSATASRGSFAVGDCLEVTSTTSGALDNAKLVREDCAAAHFGTVVARVGTKAECPATSTISRIDDGGQVLCLGQDAQAAIARPGDCVRVPTTFALPLIRTDCAAATAPFRLEAIVDDPTQCPTGTRGGPYSGYDRVLCVRFPN
jgi:hypothetical protein